jgi:hypothetical protein
MLSLKVHVDKEDYQARGGVSKNVPEAKMQDRVEDEKEK